MDKKELENIRDVEKFLKKADTFYLATVEGDQPRVRPFGTINIFEGKLYVQTGKHKAVFKQLMIDPKVEVCGSIRKTKTLRITGELVDDNRVEAKKSMLDAYPNLRGIYNEHDENTSVMYFRNATAVFSALDRDPEVVTFGFEQKED